MAGSETFDQLRKRVSGLTRDGRFAEAYESVTAAAPRFPDEGSDIYYLRSCLAARMGDRDLSVALIRQALECGYFYSELVLRQSPSWRQLQGWAPFEQVAELCMRRQQDLATPAQVLVQRPGGGKAPFRTLVALHGNGGNAAETLAHWQPVVGERRLLAAVQSSQPVARDGYVWDDQALAWSEVAEQYRALAEAHDADERHVVVAGFSMGAETALQVSLRGLVPACGFILIGAAGPTTAEPDSLPPLVELQRATGRELRGFILLGELDDEHRLERHQRIAGYLTEGGIPCEFEVLSGVGHRYPDEFAATIERALTFVDP